MRTEINAGFDVKQGLKDLIEKKISKLERFYDHIMDCQVFLKEEGHSERNNEKHLEIRVNVKDAKLFCSEKSERFEQAIDLAVENMSRQLKKYKEKHS